MWTDRQTDKMTKPTAAFHSSALTQGTVVPVYAMKAHGGKRGTLHIILNPPCQMEVECQHHTPVALSLITKTLVPAE